MLPAVTARSEFVTVVLASAETPKLFVPVARIATSSSDAPCGMTTAKLVLGPFTATVSFWTLLEGR